MLKIHVIIILMIDTIVSLEYNDTLIFWIKDSIDLATANDFCPEVMGQYNWLNNFLPFFLSLGNLFLNLGNDPWNPLIPHSLACLKDTQEFDNCNRCGWIKGNNQLTIILLIGPTKMSNASPLHGKPWSTEICYVPICSFMIGSKLEQIDPSWDPGKFSPHKNTFPSAAKEKMLFAMVSEWYSLCIAFCSTLSELHLLCSDNPSMKPIMSWAIGSCDWTNAANCCIFAWDQNLTLAKGWFQFQGFGSKASKENVNKH